MVEPQRSQTDTNSKCPAAASRRRCAPDAGFGRALRRVGEPESVAAAAHDHPLVAAVARRTLHRAGSRQTPNVARRLRTDRAGRFPRALRTSGAGARQPSPTHGHDAAWHHARESRNRRAHRRASRLSRAVGSDGARTAAAPIARVGRAESLRRGRGSKPARLRRGPRPSRRPLPDGRRPVRATLVGRGARSPRQHFSPPRSGRSIRQAAPSPAGYAGNQSWINGGVVWQVQRFGGFHASPRCSRSALRRRRGPRRRAWRR